MARRVNNVVVVLVTCANEEQGASIARSLVGERLAACVNLVSGIRSIYRWRDKLEDDRETLLLVKTRTQLLARVERRVRELHTYEVPEIVAVRLYGGSKPYLDWLLESTATRRRSKAPKP
ncbi:MAG TPA: divalent-cation tolerance protein CutA [Candidatus Binataceae bacterium]|nr:divalent-cation tolerance protein CutA [Candidatus Binataceae bacterium]